MTKRICILLGLVGAAFLSAGPVSGLDAGCGTGNADFCWSDVFGLADGPPGRLETTAKDCGAGSNGDIIVVGCGGR
jgi:hypothetical protein